MSSFYICYCGNTIDNHYFRHDYKDIVLVQLDVQDEETVFTLDAKYFPSKTKHKCSKSNCSAEKALHSSQIIEHNYDPIEYTYREINFSIPEDTRCNYMLEGKRCCCKLKDHENILTHHFHTKVVILNKQDTDIINIVDSEDEDKKIINS
jgi:hypothetical protein